MSWTKMTGSKYHTQDDSNFCGPACAMMLLGGLGTKYSDLDQDDVFTAIQANNVNNADWFSDPIGLNTTINSLRPAGFPKAFKVHRESSETDGSYKMLSILQQNGPPSIALMFLIRHWVIVCGVQTDVDPSGGPYKIEGFWLHNPVDQDNEPHSKADACGTGNHGQANQWVSYDHWRETFFVGAKFDDPGNATQFLFIATDDPPAIPPPLKPAGAPLHAAGVPLPGGGVPLPGGGTPLPAAKPLLQAPAMLDLFRKNLARYGLDQNAVTAKACACSAGAPLLVRRLDQPGRSYALVPSEQAGAVVSYGQIDATDGNLESIYVLDGGAKPYERDPASIAQSLAGTDVTLPGDAGTLKLIANEFTVDPQLVWKPCRESKWAHLPFWRIIAGSHVFYLRLDGRLFTDLTIDGRGG